MWKCFAAKEVLKTIKLNARIAHLNALLMAANSRYHWAVGVIGELRVENERLKSKIEARRSSNNGGGDSKGSGSNNISSD